MTIDDVRKGFEDFYRARNVIRNGARGRASRHLERHDGEYISDHAAECWMVWFESYSWVTK